MYFYKGGSMDGGSAAQKTNTVLSFTLPHQAADTAQADVLPADYAVLIIDLHGQIQFASANTNLLIDMPGVALQGSSIATLFPAFPLGDDINANRNYLKNQSSTGDWRCIRLNNDNAILEFKLNRTEIGNQLLGIVMLRPIAKDMTHRHFQNFIKPLIDSEELLVVTETTGKIIYVNPAFETTSGYTLAEAAGQTLEDILAWEKYPPLYSQMWSTLCAGKSFHGIFINRKKDQRLFHEDRYARPFVNLGGGITHYIFTGRDVSDRERLLQRLEHTANHDDLTDLPNRHLFLDRIHRAQIHATRWENGFAVLLLDLDNFKAINDGFGHDAGDAALVTVANRVGTCIREEDTLARLGGDEFAIILTELATLQDVKQVLDKIVSLLRKPFQYQGSKLSIQASIGVAFYPADALRTDILFKHADSAMYHAKAAGGNRYHIFNPRLDLSDNDTTSGQYILLSPHDKARLGMINVQHSSSTVKEQDK